MFLIQTKKIILARCRAFVPLQIIKESAGKPASCVVTAPDSPRASALCNQPSAMAVDFRMDQRNPDVK